MIIKANEIRKYMEIHSVDKIPVEVVNVELPENKELRQGARHFAKRLVITNAHAGQHGSFHKHKGIEAVRLNYVIYNSFRKSECFVPVEWEFEVLAGDLGQKILDEFADHGGNLEKKFREAFEKINPEIQEKVAAASKLLKEAEKLSEQHGLPFRPKGNLLDGSCHGYFPASFSSIYGDLLEENPDLVDDVTGVYRYEENGDGWQSSAGTC
jgi:hypothetical protein